MPMAENYSDYGRPIRALLYGADKTRKTWWALKSAEAGFNVVMLDGDDGTSIVTQIPKEARKRILLVDGVNTRERAVFSRLLASFLRPGNDFFWDEQDKISVPKTMMKSDHSYIHFCPSKFTMNDVVILDSWTALAASTLIEWAKEVDVDLTAIEKEGDQFALLNFQARFLDYCLNQLHTLPCHVIVIGHETVYEKWEGKGALRRMTEQVTIPISSTGPQGKKLGKHFSNVFRFKKQSDINYTIDTGGDKDVAGGSRLFPPKVYKWEEITPAMLFNAVGAKATGEPCLGAVWLPAKSNEQVNSAHQIQEIPATQTMPAQPQVLNAGETRKLSLAERLKLKST